MPGAVVVVPVVVPRAEDEDDVVAVFVDEDVEVGLVWQPAIEGTASGPAPISTTFVPQSSAGARCRLRLS